MNLNIATTAQPQQFVPAVYENPNEHNPEGSLSFRFTRYEVTNLNFRRFLAIFDPERLNAETIRSLRGNLAIQLPSTSARHEEPFLCETTRRFCQAFHNVFPAWAYFFTLESLALWKMSLCLLDQAQIIQSDHAWKTRLVLPPEELGQMIAQHIEAARGMAARSNMPNRRVEQMLASVLDYFTKVTGAYCRA